MSRGKHASGRIKIFGVNHHGKHAKNEMVVYNPVYAKISSCLGSLAIATSLLTFVTLGKYKGTLASSDTARVARYMLELNKTEASVTEMLPETTENIEFKVKNYNDAKQNEVNLRYRIIVEMPEVVNLPINYTLYRVYSNNVEEEVTLQGGVSNYITVDTSNVEHNYRLKMEWQNGQDSILYQNLTDNIKISIDSEQID